MQNVMIIGNVGREPEVKTFDSGDQIVNFSVAVTEKWKDKQGQPQEHTEWFNCTARGNGLVGMIDRNVGKGTKLFVGGKLKTREYQKDGETKKAVELQVRDIEIIGNWKGDQQGQQQPQQQGFQPQQGFAPQQPQQGYGQPQGNYPPQQTMAQQNPNYPAADGSNWDQTNPF
ncbi:single-stranded DNA-binding protein [Ferrimonas balearica]|uniref:single-stranded DNA-binding protein n=1 Tax=Ferrimonas balearica TaxID=44012 RepID=UPI001C9871BE|nr:single-stranded DNA-binding protein [Ferrimonas balearica]MBY6104977.1 single-stranded DNA-binding protein [Ferrimonas balearica]